MHTVEELHDEDFEYRIDGRIVPRGDVLPHIVPADRVGVVMNAGSDGLGAGNFLLSCVIAFYSRLRATESDAFGYPDYYTFQTTSEPADYRMLDVYPDHKNVRVDRDPERILRAVNDRAINILLVPNDRKRPPTIDDVSRHSAERRIDRCYLYAPDGTLDDPGFSIHVPREPVKRWYASTADSDSFGGSRGEIVQQFRHIPLEEAVSRLPHRAHR